MTLEDKVAFLSRADSHVGLHRPPRTMETHMSWLFLVGQEVLKLKKPVRYPFLDFSTLAAREHFCREEVRLNARLAPGVYLGLAALTSTQAGLRLTTEPKLGTAGEASRRDVVEWLVRMRRLPEARNLRRLLGQGPLPTAPLNALALALADFYRKARHVAIEPEELLRRLAREQAANREVLLRPDFHLRDAAAVIDQLDLRMVQHTGLLMERAAQGRMVDGHGDLRPEHVYLLDPPVVIDGLEFNPELREVDPFDELAFLALECTMAGAGSTGTRLIRACARALDDSPPRTLLDWYTARRAVIRARLAMAHLLDPHPRAPRRWPPLAQRYLDLAARVLRRAVPARRVMVQSSRRPARGGQRL